MKITIKNFLFFLFSICLAKNGSAQNSTLDSLKQALSIARHDTTKCGVLFALSETAPDGEWEKYSEELELTAKKVIDANYKGLSKKKYYYYLSSALNNKGLNYQNTGDYYNAIVYYKKSLKVQDEAKDPAGKASTLNNIATLYYQQGDFVKAVDTYYSSIKISEELKDTKEIANVFNNLALLFNRQGELEKAKEFHIKALKLREEIGDSRGIANSYANLATIYSSAKDYQLALDYYNKSYQMRSQLGDKRGMASVLMGIGKIYEKRENYDSALICLDKSIKLCEEINNREIKASATTNIIQIYYLKKEYAKARIYGEENLKLSREIGIVHMIGNTAGLLHKVYKASNMPEKALEAYELFISMRDSTNNEETQKAAITSQMNYEFNKKLLADSLMNAAIANEEKLKHEEEIKTQKTYTYGGLIGAAFMLLIAITSFKAYKNKQKANLTITRQKEEVEKQKNIIEVQKGLVESHQKDIIDSITYAKRIQEAILPPENFIKKYLPDCFIFYKPKDIVAGDFYWFEEINGASYFAAADCTGHGVPGAMVSVVCSNALNRAVLEFKLTDPGKILDKTRELVLDTFSKSDKDVKDGMDISLVKIEIVKESKKMQPGKIVIPKGQSFSDVAESLLKYRVEWAGANNPLWYFKNGEHFEITAHKQAIGKTENATAFPTHSIELGKGDMLYLLTDGYADQFGGPKGKKFKYKQLLNLVQKGLNESAGSQKQGLNTAFENWKGNLEQIDDVTIIGIRV